MARSSSRSYSPKTIKLLWGRAAGRCAVPSCRIELFAEATDYDPVVTLGEIAHIEAASDDGPRANPEMDERARDDYDNLVLLCQNCHARLDGQKLSNTVQAIRTLKQDHENWVRNSLPERGRSLTGWVTLALQGAHPFDVDRALETLSPDFSAGSPMVLRADPETAAWDSIRDSIRDAVHGMLASGDPFDFRLAVFALAPVSMCIALGYFLTSRPRVRLFQYHRDDHSWSWPALAPRTAELSIAGVPDSIQNDFEVVAICFHLSARITDRSVAEAFDRPVPSVHVVAPKPSTSWLTRADQLRNLAQAARTTFELIRERYPNATSWHIFYAGPAPAAVLIGQQLNPTMSPAVQLYEFRQTMTPAYQRSTVLEAYTT